MNNRLVGLDLARSVAIFGMILVNYNIVLHSSERGNKFLRYSLTFLEGKAASLFVILAGIGISLMVGRKKNPKMAKNILIKRAAFLFFGGLLYSPIWPADILHFYGVYIFLASFLISVKPRTLLYLALLSNLVFVTLLGIIDYSTGWNFSTLEYTDFWTIEGQVRHIFYNGFHPVFPWISFIFIGMYIGRMDLSSKNTQKWLLIFGIILSSVTLLLSYIGKLVFSFPDAEYVVGTQPLPPFPLFIFLGTGTSLIVISICMWIGNWRENTAVKLLVYVGQMSLTNYVMHVIIGMALLEVLGYLERVNNIEFTLMVSLLMYLLIILFSYFWSTKYKRGPLELIIRKYTN